MDVQSMYRIDKHSKMTILIRLMRSVVADLLNYLLKSQKVFCFLP